MRFDRVKHTAGTQAAVFSTAEFPKAGSARWQRRCWHNRTFWRYHTQGSSGLRELAGHGDGCRRRGLPQHRRRRGRRPLCVGQRSIRPADTASRLVPTRVAGLPAPVRQVATGFYHTGIVTEAGDLLMCGLASHGRLGLGDEDDRTTRRWWRGRCLTARRS